MKTIYKYGLSITDTQNVQMPFGARILCVQVQRGTPCIWAEVDTEEERTEMRRIDIYGTGHPMDRNPEFGSSYIGTFQVRDGDFVFHVYERVL